MKETKKKEPIVIDRILHDRGVNKIVYKRKQTKTNK